MAPLAWASTSCILPGRGQVVDPMSVRAAAEVSPKAPRTRSEPSDHAKQTGSAAAPPVPPRQESDAGDEGRFCRMMRPVLGPLRAATSRHLRCISSQYVEAGFVGNTRDLATHSIHGACFQSSRWYGEEVEYHEQPLHVKLEPLVLSMSIDDGSRIDLSAYGIPMAPHALDGIEKPTQAAIQVFFDAPVLRAPVNLASSLAKVAADRDAPEEVRAAAERCQAMLCDEAAVYTAELMSASPRVVVTLAEGGATTLRPVSFGLPSTISGDGRTFVIKPLTRVNVMARFRLSRPDFMRVGACSPTKRDIMESPRGDTVPGTTIIHRGIHATLVRCNHANGDGSVECELSFLSPMRDQRLELYLARGRDEPISSIVDSNGTHYRGVPGGRHGRGTGSSVIIPLVANTPTPFSLMFSNVTRDGDEIPPLPKVTIVARTDREIYFAFRGVPVERSAGELVEP